MVTSEVAAVTINAHSQLHADSDVPNPQHVTFPTDFHVSEALKNGLIFGSFDNSFGWEIKHDNVTSVEINSAKPIEASQGSDEIAGEPSSRLVDFNFLHLLELIFCFSHLLLWLPKKNIFGKYL